MENCLIKCLPSLNYALALLETNDAQSLKWRKILL